MEGGVPPLPLEPREPRYERTSNVASSHRRAYNILYIYYYILYTYIIIISIIILIAVCISFCVNTAQNLSKRPTPSRARAEAALGSLDAERNHKL